MMNKFHKIEIEQLDANFCSDYVNFDMKTSFGAWLAETRTKKGYRSRNALAVATGIDAATIKHLEEGTSERPRNDTMDKLLAVLAGPGARPEDIARLRHEAEQAVLGKDVTNAREECMLLLAPAGFENMPVEAHVAASRVALQHFEVAYRIEMQKWSEKATDKPSTAFIDNLPELSGTADEIVFPELFRDKKDTSTDPTPPSNR